MLFLATLALAALLVAWVVNILVGVLSGEKPQSTSSLWAEVFSRILMVSELGLIGRVLNYCGLTGLPRKAVLFLGVLCLLLFMVRARRHHDNANSTMIFTTNYPAKTP